MKRLIYNQLLTWKQKRNRKPLILKGARQVGKTYSLLDFAKAEYENMAYFNFESSPHLRTLFAQGLKPADIIKALSIEANTHITPEKTLIIFDEIQACAEALNSLKYFNEFANEYHIASAGSLLGVTLANAKNFPVGKVDFLSLYPLSFTEFLLAKKNTLLTKFLDEIDTLAPLPENVHEKLLSHFREYLYIGGMPAAVMESIESDDFEKIRYQQQNILDAYRLDFAKHAPDNIIMKLNQVWDVIPNQLAKENKKFIYSVIRQGARAAEFETAIQWLSEAGLIHKVHNTNTPKIPLNAYIHHDIFKIYLSDVGLLGAMSNISAKSILYGDSVLQEFRGALTENYVCQSLVNQKNELFYWSSEGIAELDFLYVHDDNIYPLEVKSGASNKKKSLQLYLKKYEPRLGIRLSPMNLKKDGDILNCPLYLLDHIKKLLQIS
ncbi:MAG TPA: AAA family ATPase [Gammaproteobacteria bacterium]|jgi:predicted AAA+ superfamily ATPase|nr:AAA family ATPase [Gammaproteobacteria bacterium]